jgi:4-amino-4-deoxy-L-arabinose transferase-like glycosyltransferase
MAGGERKARSWNESSLHWVMIGAIALISAVHFLTLTVYPSVFIDEGWLANTSWSWLQTGVAFDRIHQGVLDQFGYQWVTEVFLGQFPYLVAYNFLGVGLFQTRLVSWLFGVLLLLATAQVGTRLYNRGTGLLAALLLSLTIPFLQSSRWRQDIMLAAIIMVSFWLALYALEKNKIWAHFLAGLLLGLGFDVQQSAIVFIPPLAALYLAYYGRRVFFVRGTWIVGIGGALGLFYYVATHVLPSYEVYSQLMSFYFAPGADAQIPLTRPSLLVQSAISEFGRYRFRESWFDFGLLCLGGLLLLLRRSKSDVLLLVYTIAAFVSSILLSSNKTNLYAIDLYPFFILIIAAAFARLIQAGPSKNVTRLAQAVLLLFIGFGIFQVASRIYNNHDYNYYGITDRIRQVIPADKRVMGMPTWWFGFPDYDFRSSLTVPYYRFFNDYTVTQAFDAVRPDYIIVDVTQQAVLVDEGQTLVQGVNVFRVNRLEFNDVLAEHGELVLEFSDPWHGDFSIYRLDWGS